MNVKPVIQKVVTVIPVITLFLASGLCCTSCSCVGDAQFPRNIAVIKALDKPLDKGSAISVSVARAGARKKPTESTDWQHAAYDGPLSFLEADLRTSLKDMGFIPKFGKVVTQWGIDCEFTETWGRLVFDSNGRLHMIYYGMVNLKLIDNETKAIVGEVEYQRPRFSMSPTTLADGLVKRLMQGVPQVP